MRKKLKNVLIFGATSDMARGLISKLLIDGVTIFAASRSNLAYEHKNLHKYNFDFTIEENINSFFRNLGEIKFDAVLNFQGIAVCSPVEHLNKKELERQFEISLYSLLYILKNLENKTDKNSLIVNISSMASFGLFPYLSPYSMAKASSEILLNAYEIETGIKTVSIKPGAVITKFWERSVDGNKNNLENLAEKYHSAGEFLKHNALTHTKSGILPQRVSKLCYDIIHKKNPKSAYLIGCDAKMAYLASLLKGRLLFSWIRKLMNKKIKDYTNDR